VDAVGVGKWALPLDVRPQIAPQKRRAFSILGMEAIVDLMWKDKRQPRQDMWPVDRLVLLRLKITSMIMSPSRLTVYGDRGR
jgi:hypothetical protein